MCVSLKDFREQRLGIMHVHLVVFSVVIVLIIVAIDNNKTFAEPILKDSSLRAELVVAILIQTQQKL